MRKLFLVCLGLLTASIAQAEKQTIHSVESASMRFQNEVLEIEGTIQRDGLLSKPEIVKGSVSSLMVESPHCPGSCYAQLSLRGVNELVAVITIDSDQDGNPDGRETITIGWVDSFGSIATLQEFSLVPVYVVNSFNVVERIIGLDKEAEKKEYLAASLIIAN